MAKSKITVNPIFKLDVTGKLFLNKDTNKDVQETVLFNKLITLLNIEKGTLATFPNLGLKQYLYSMCFNDESDTIAIINEFEEECKRQLNQPCTINYKFDSESKTVKASLEIENLNYGIDFEYTLNNNSIKVINYYFNEMEN